MSELERISGVSSSDLDFHTRAGDPAKSLGDTATALAFYRPAINLHPHLTSSYLRIAYLSIRFGAFADALVP
jgi:hypothetical protein